MGSAKQFRYKHAMGYQSVVSSVNLGLLTITICRQEFPPGLIPLIPPTSLEPVLLRKARRPRRLFLAGMGSRSSPHPGRAGQGSVGRSRRGPSPSRGGASPTAGAARGRPAAAGGHSGARRRLQREGLGGSRRLPSGPRGGGVPGGGEPRGAARSGNRAAIAGSRFSASGSRRKPRASSAPAGAAARPPRHRAAVPGTKSPSPVLKGVPAAAAAAETPCPGWVTARKPPGVCGLAGACCGKGPRSAPAVASNFSRAVGPGLALRKRQVEAVARAARASCHWPIAYKKGGQDTEKFTVLLFWTLGASR